MIRPWLKHAPATVEQRIAKLPNRVTFRNAIGHDELVLYGDIGDGMFGEGITAKSVVAELANAKSSTLKVRVNSSGGSIIEAQAIYAQLTRHPARIEITVDGLAASAASFLIMAGDSIAAMESATLMVHNPWAWSAGDANEHRALADVLDKMKASITTIYAARTKQTAAKLSKLMDNETWMSASEAKSLGFIDTIIANKSSSKVAASSTNRIAASSNARSLSMSYAKQAEAASAKGQWRKASALRRQAIEELAH